MIEILNVRQIKKTKKACQRIIAFYNAEQLCGNPSNQSPE